MNFSRVLLVTACVLLGPGVRANGECSCCAGSSRPDEPAPSSCEETHEVLTAADWAGLRAAYSVGRHALLAVEGGYRARNPGQRWTTSFDGRGFTVEPDCGGWTWGLELVHFGFEGHARNVEGEARASAAGQRLAYAWGATLIEWYVNDARGLEHGYTVHERPAHDAGVARDERGSLTVTLAVRGGLRATVQDGGRGVRFESADGADALTYGGLTVFDANGRNLPARFELVREGLRICVDERGARYPLTIDPVAQQSYLKASNPDAGDSFGHSVSASGDTVVVGAFEESSSANGVGGSQGSNGASRAGAAYVFVRSGASWSQQAYIKASNSDAQDWFGVSVSVAGDTLVIGASGEDSRATGVDGDQSNNGVSRSGAAYVFVRNGASWSQQAYLKASYPDGNDQFGVSVSVSGDTVVVGAYGEGSSATAVDGDPSNNNAPNSGAAYVFARSGTSWSQQAYLKASNTGSGGAVGIGDLFGSSVSVSGDTVVVGAPYEDSSATGVDGGQSNNGATNSGAAYVFVRSGASWSQQAYLKASNTGAFDRFGDAVSASGDTVLVGAFVEDSNAIGVGGDQGNNSAGGSGAAYVFVRSGTSWSQQAYLKASNTQAGDQFGRSVSISGDMALVGTHFEDSNAIGVDGEQSNNEASNSGAAYVFVRIGTSWFPRTYLKASNTDAGDEFGASVAVSGDTVVIGASRESSGSAGVNGDGSDDSAVQAGAAYIYSVSDTSFCDASDGALASCPCSPGSADSGCDNAQATGGVDLVLLTQSTSPNAAAIAGTGFPTTGSPTAIVMRASALDPSGPAVFGDGVRCVDSGPLVLLSPTFAAGGMSMHTFGHGAGAGTFYYQVWYRNTPDAFCTPAAFNTSSGLELVW